MRRKTARKALGLYKPSLMRNGLSWSSSRRPSKRSLGHGQVATPRTFISLPQRIVCHNGRPEVPAAPAFQATKALVNAQA